MQEDFLSILDNLSKSRAERKKEEYLKKLKEKKLEKKKNKKKNKFVNAEALSELIDSTPIKEFVKKENSMKEYNDDIQQMMKDENIEIEYVDEDPLSKPKMYNNFKNVFDYFVIPKKEKKEIQDEDEEEDYDLENDGYDEDMDGVPIHHLGENHPQIQKLSKKKRKMLSRMKISELKALTDYPEVVESWDVTAQDPILLIKFKTMKNTVAVPKHWAHKRKFLQNKRGVLKPPFKLPDFIEATGISKIRDNTGADKKALKQKMRERMQPKLGKMDIDYQVLHDAFFRNQTKPQLSLHGDIYYENKEHENKMKIYKPGRISEKLRVALGIPENSPPPWIINMQRYGPPPSYSNLKIPGVNAPLLDPTAEITPNLWTPPVLEEKPELVYDFSKNKKDQEHWGDLREVEEDEISEELNDDISIDEEEPRPSVDNLFSGLDMNLSGESKIKMNYSAIGTETSASSETIITQQQAVPNPNANIVFPSMTASEKSFYTVLEQKQANIKQSEIYGSSFKYVIPGQEDKDKIIEAEKSEIAENLEKAEKVEKEEIKSDATKAAKPKPKKQPTFKF
jgi:splicing factor 3B subunit 2